MQSIGTAHWNPPPSDARQEPPGAQLVVSSVPVHEFRHPVPSVLHAYGEHIGAQQLFGAPGVGGVH